jgi:hypothetical protein
MMQPSDHMSTAVAYSFWPAVHSHFSLLHRLHQLLAARLHMPAHGIDELAAQQVDSK